MWATQRTRQWIEERPQCWVGCLSLPQLRPPSAAQWRFPPPRRPPNGVSATGTAPTLVDGAGADPDGDGRGLHGAGVDLDGDGAGRYGAGAGPDGLDAGAGLDGVA